MQFLSDPAWLGIVFAIVGVVGALFSLFISILIYLKQRSRKEISLEVVSSTSLLSIKDMIKDQVQVLFQGAPVTDVYLLVLKIQNSGNVPILPHDYYSPILIDFGKNTNILSTELLETNPSVLKNRASVRIIGGKLEISPLLLNSKDSLKLQIILSRYDGQFNVDGTILGARITAHTF